MIAEQTKAQQHALGLCGPAGVASTAAHDEHVTTVWLWENTVVMLKHPWHLTSMK